MVGLPTSRVTHLHVSSPKMLIAPISSAGFDDHVFWFINSHVCCCLSPKFLAIWSISMVLCWLKLVNLLAVTGSTSWVWVVWYTNHTISCYKWGNLLRARRHVFMIFLCSFTKIGYVFEQALAPNECHLYIENRSFFEVQRSNSSGPRVENQRVCITGIGLNTTWPLHYPPVISFSSLTCPMVRCA